MFLSRQRVHMAARDGSSTLRAPGTRAAIPLVLLLAGLPFGTWGSRTCRGAVLSDASEEQPQDRFENSNGLHVPLTRMEDRTVVVDGDLSDWGDLRDRGFALDQHLCGIMPLANPSAADAALVKLMRDEYPASRHP